MTRLLVGLGVAAAVFWIYALVDTALVDRSRIRGVPRAVWLIIEVFLPVVGGVLWFLIGRARRNPVAARTVAPDDDPEFLGQLGRDSAQEERIRRLEQELAELDSDADSPASDTAVTPKVDPTDTDHRTDGDKPGRTDA